MKIRINNIGVEPVVYLEDLGKNDKVDALEDIQAKLTQKGKTLSLSIVKYHPNRYYGLLEEYLQNGWDDKGEYIECKNNTISKNSFLHKETNYVVAFLHLHENEDETQLESVGDRLLYIEESDKNNFFEVYRLADKYLQEKSLKVSQTAIPKEEAQAIEF